VRSNWRNRTKRLRGLPEICRIECIENEESILEALKRFIAIEQSGWKRGVNLGIAKDLRHKIFYEDLVVDLSRKNRVAIYLLKLGDKDIAASIMYKFSGVQYERHIAYNPEYSAYSPGIILRTEILKALFGTKYKECDLLGFRSNNDGQQHKIDWATGKRETIRTVVYRRKSRITPILLARRIEAWLKARQ
jgi:CelD/BcsL family acetyltransferase involved in cellulose biosynthesis